MFNKIRYIYLYKLKWLGIYNSPFKSPKIEVYVGKRSIGFPYMLPRKLGKDGVFRRKYLGFSGCGLGYKTKWSSTDYRHEWNPSYGFIVWNFQVAITFSLDCRSWESWLLYRHFRRGGLSNLDALVKVREINPNVWVSYKDGAQEKTDWFLKSLKSRFRDYFKTNE